MTRVSLYALLLAIAAASTARAGESGSGIETRFTLPQLGLRPEVLQTTTRAKLDIPFPSRRDRVLTAARLVLVPGAADPAMGVQRLDVLVNGERAGALEGSHLAEPGREHAIAIDPAFLGEHNTLSLRLVVAGGECEGRVPAGAWALVARGFLEVRTTALRGTSDLSLLPMPFFDETFDRDASLPIVLPAPATPARIRVAALVASWFGQRARGSIRFPVHVGSLPEGNALVIVDGPAAATALGLEAATEPTIQFVDGPAGRGADSKLLVLGGRALDDVETVALALATGRSFTGGTAVVQSRPQVPVLAPYAAPRWLPTSARVSLAPVVGQQARRLDGGQSGSMTLGFRLAPDLFLWEASRPAIELGFGAKLPRGTSPPLVSVELNGRFLGTLPVAAGRKRTRLPINREHLIGFNELTIHVDNGPVGCGDEVAAASEASFWVDPDSALLLSSPAHFVTLPDLSLFVHDGFPFTRHPDLAGTVAVLPDEAKPREIETLLTLVAHFAAITGHPATGLAVTTSAGVGAYGERDVLVIGSAATQPLLRRWQQRLPIRFDREQPVAQVPARGWSAATRAVLQGRIARGEIARADAVLSANPDAAVTMAIESPLRAGRTAVIVTAARAEAMPLLSALQGFADSRDPKEDVLVVAGEERWMFRLGSSWDTGKVDRRRRFLWFLSQHWVAAFPFTVLGALSLAAVIGSGLRRKQNDRRREQEGKR